MTKGRRIFSLPCQRYKEKKKESKESRYAYEEMLITIGELREGVGETAAYENFAVKVGLYGGVGRALWQGESGSMPKRVGQYDQTARTVDAAWWQE